MRRAAKTDPQKPNPKPAKKKADPRTKITLTDGGIVERARTGAWLTADVEHEGRTHQFRVDVVGLPDGSYSFQLWANELPMPVVHRAVDLMRARWEKMRKANGL